MTAPALPTQVLTTTGRTMADTLLLLALTAGIGYGGYRVYKHFSQLSAEEKISSDPNYQLASRLHSAVEDKKGDTIAELGTKVTDYDAVQAAYRDLYGKSLVDDITESVGSGHYTRFVQNVNANKSLSDIKKNTPVVTQRNNPTNVPIRAGMSVRIKPGTRTPIPLYAGSDDPFRVKKVGTDYQPDPLVSGNINTYGTAPFATVQQVVEKTFTKPGSVVKVLMAQIRFNSNGLLRWINSLNIEQATQVKGLGCACSSSLGCAGNENTGCGYSRDNNSPYYPICVGSNCGNISLAGLGVADNPLNKFL